VQPDIRDHPLYTSVEEEFKRILEPSLDRISSAISVGMSPLGGAIAFTGSKYSSLDGDQTTHICLTTGTGFREITHGSTDKNVVWSPDGRYLSFLSDRDRKGRFQLYVLSHDQPGEAEKLGDVPGTIEHHAWSPDGLRITVVVAGDDAEAPGVRESGSSSDTPGDLPQWMPHVSASDRAVGWRTVWTCDVKARTWEQFSPDGLNIWEADWIGCNGLLALVSDTPDESSWYHSRLSVLASGTPDEQVLLRPAHQLACPTAAPVDYGVAVIHSLASDRGVLAGDIFVFDSAAADPRTISTNGADVYFMQWIDGTRIAFLGFRDLSTVIGVADVPSGISRDLWVFDGTVSAVDFAVHSGRVTFAAVAHSTDMAPRIVSGTDAEPPELVCDFADASSPESLARFQRLEPVEWKAPDGQTIRGFFVVPDRPGPYPLVVNIHGGPVGSHRRQWLMRGPTQSALLLHGYAIFYPNPRGSSGRGQEFIELELGDYGGGELQDILSGVDFLVENRNIDPGRIAIMGGSHGGYMAAWAVSQSDRFAASVAMSPVIDWVSQHFTSNIGAFDSIFLKAEPWDADRAYYTRSPLMHARSVKTPTLLTAGLNDRCTPPGQAIEFYNALKECGVDTALVLYPKEGHGVRQIPALKDLTARVLIWLDRHMRAKDKSV
jgi:dipeptidyl aminopeptidase/acylaminoacyl peptidase